MMLEAAAVDVVRPMAEEDRTDDSGMVGWRLSRGLAIPSA